LLNIESPFCQPMLSIILFEDIFPFWFVFFLESAGPKPAQLHQDRRRFRLSGEHFALPPPDPGVPAPNRVAHQPRGQAPDEEHPLSLSQERGHRSHEPTSWPINKSTSNCQNRASSRRGRIKDLVRKTFCCFKKTLGWMNSVAFSPDYNKRKWGLWELSLWHLNDNWLRVF